VITAEKMLTSGDNFGNITPICLLTIYLFTLSERQNYLNTVHSFIFYDRFRPIIRPPAGSFTLKIADFNQF
jgi:hypothetical protein